MALQQVSIAYQQSGDYGQQCPNTMPPLPSHSSPGETGIGLQSVWYSCLYQNWIEPGVQPRPLRSDFLTGARLHSLYL